MHVLGKFLCGILLYNPSFCCHTACLLLAGALHNVVLPDLAMLNAVGTHCQLLALEHSGFSRNPLFSSGVMVKSMRQTGTDDYLTLWLKRADG